MKKKGSELWVGIFVVTGIFLLGYLTFKIERFELGKAKGYAYHIYFDSAGGLERNAPVRIAGVRMGVVEQVILEGGRVKITFHLPETVSLHEDGKAYIKSEGFLGEKYVEIFPGTPRFRRLEPNTIIAQGEPPIDVEQFLSRVVSIGDDIKEVTKPMAETLRAVDAKKLEGIIDNLNSFSRDLGGLAKDSKGTIQMANQALSRIEEVGAKLSKGEGTLGKLITDESMYQEAKKTLEKAAEAVGDIQGAAQSVKKTIEKAEGAVDDIKGAMESARETADTLKAASEKVERGEGLLGKLIHDETLYQDAKETIESAKKTMQSANEALQSVKEVTAKIERGEGTLGKLVHDETLIKEAEKTMKKVQKASEAIEEQAPITILGTIFGIFF